MEEAWKEQVHIVTEEREREEDFKLHLDKRKKKRTKKALQGVLGLLFETRRTFTKEKSSMEWSFKSFIFLLSIKEIHL